VRRLPCLLGRHDWQPHPAFENLPVRWCLRCSRVESSVFALGRWSHIAHLDGLTELECRVRTWHRKVARELNEQLMRRGDPRALW
jgi:hypothetical protein